MFYSIIRDGDSMVDPRDTRLADLLVHYSIDLKKNENVYLLTDSVDTLPLFLEVYKKIIQGGGNPFPHILLDPHASYEVMDYTFMKHTSEKQLKQLSELKLKEMQAMHAYIKIGGPANKYDLAGIDQKRIALRKRITKPILDERLRKKWAVTRYPTSSMAQAANMSTEDFATFFYNACLTDWSKQEKIQEQLTKILEEGKVMRILGEDTDLHIGIEGRKFKKCIAKCQFYPDIGRYEGANIPDGEIYTGPVENFTHGYIKYTYPYTEGGKKIEGISLTFEHGKVTKYNAERNQEALESLLGTDAGAKRLGEVAIGTNPKITRFMDETLFDEKILGTVHITPGNSYEGHGFNKSAIHADIVKDLRPKFGGGEIQIDGEVIQKNGKWTFV
jgi:aminopeptidase